MTQEQDVVKAKKQIAILKESYIESLGIYMVVEPKDGQAAMNAALECQKRGTAYFNYAEEFVGTSDLLGAHKSAIWAQGFAEDCAELLGSMPAHFRFLKQAFSRVEELKNLSPLPGITAFANMQRMSVAYLQVNLVQDLQNKFKADGLPTYGFQYEAKRPMNKQATVLLAFIFGVVFVSVILIIAFNKPDPTDFQYTVFRTVLAMSCAGIGAVIPGFIEVRVSKFIVAGGALAVFVIVYFWNPALQEATKKAAVSSPPINAVPLKR
jgi:hypothetical protein